MKIPGFYITLLGIFILGVTSVILAYSANPLTYFLVVLGVLISIIGAYLQYEEAKTIKIKMDFIKMNLADKYTFVIPFSQYKKEHPIIDLQYEDGRGGTWECMMRPKTILPDGTIIFESETLPSNSLCCIIK